MYTVKQAQEILKAEPVDLFEKAHKVGDIHPNGKWVWTEIHPGKFDWRVIGGRRNKKSAAAGGSSNDSKAKTQLSGSKPSASKKTATDASTKATAKPSSKVRGITKNADGSLTMKSPDIDNAADVSKLLDEANCSKNAKGEYKVKVKSLGVNRGTMTLSPKEILSYARQYSTSGNTVTFTPVKDSSKTTTNTLPKEPLDAQEKKYLLWKEAGPASNLSSINRNFKREVTSTEEGLHVFKGKNDWFEMTVKKDGNKFVYTLYRVDGLPKVKMNELEKHSAIAATVTSDKQIKVAKTFYKKLFS